ncbi:hypothetical protein RJ641_022173 [Dillenia turbinata]|uniref:Histone acetyltransferase n=1 Tax=Dillenia turbinata TaxID=194707 RepID=A0AAN8YTZ1_9MAGN
MPRPGPRPYECVRRAWHSDRHQPIRGSLIQEIFRIVNEVHSVSTKKNKEWQEKLPVVVLKAEEIMYSKANSEAEYMDLKTLWDRANDAINTIIRRDDSSEAGELLQPCIEAALHLGCTPRRASRSQRNCNPRCYLNPTAQESNTVSPVSNIPNAPQKIQTPNVQPMPSFTTLVKPNATNFVHVNTKPQILVNHNKGPFPCEQFPPSCGNQNLPIEIFPASNLCSVYPLFYGNHLQNEEAQTSSKASPKLNSNNMEPAKTSVVNNLKISQFESEVVIENPQETECDLSLRLGPTSVRCTSAYNSLPQDVDDVGSSTSREGSKLSDPLERTDMEFSFISNKGNADGPLDSCSCKWISGTEKINNNASMRKRKAVAGHDLEDCRGFWQL